MLKVRFYQIKNAVIMEVLEQGKETKIGCGEFFKASNGINFVSVQGTQLGEKTLYVRGMNAKLDNKVSAHIYPSVDVAQRAVEKYVQAVQEYNRSLKKEVELIESDVKITIAE